MWRECNIGGGEGIKGYKDGGPPTLCHPASQQGGEAEVNSLAGGAWRGWRSAGIWGEFLESESFYFHLDEEEEMWREGSKFINIKIKI